MNTTKPTHITEYWQDIKDNPIKNLATLILWILITFIIVITLPIINNELKRCHYESIDGITINENMMLNDQRPSYYKQIQNLDQFPENTMLTCKYTFIK